MTSNRSGHSRWTRIAAAGLVLVGIGALLGSATFYWVFLRDLPDPHSVADYQPSLTTTVFDRAGRPIGEFYKERRRLVPFDEVPPHVVDAFVSAEDSNFFDHEGIDLQGILRAAWVNLLAGGEIKQGGSTITQQMVKGLLLSPERSYTRKVREMILARRIEQRFTKQEILFLYLNQIYFGNGAYGIGEAARSYYDKPVSELSVSEGAQLAGLPKAPSRYSPLRNPDEAERRRRYVLGRMLEDRAIDAATHNQAVAERPAFLDGSTPEAFEAAAYFSEEVRRFLFDELGGDAVLEGGLRVETTLDLDLQRAALGALRGGLEALDRRNGYRGPLRRVEGEDLAAEIERVGEENGLGVEGDDGDAPATDEEEGPLLGVVTEVDRGAKRARIALAPGHEGRVELADASWARPIDPSTRPREVRKIEEVFRVGDVARFVRLASDGDETSEPDTLSRLGLFQEPQVQGSLVSLEVGSGDIVAMLGGYDFGASQFNRATQSRRQPGSAFKPLIYATALSLLDENGRPRYTPASIVHDRPKVYTDHRSGFVWKPKNYGRSFYGPITLRTALAKSVNNAAVHLCDEVGVDRVIRLARRLGVHSPLEASLALALGTSGVSLLELTRAYAVFPNGGRRVVPRFVTRVIDRSGRVLMENVPLGDPDPVDSDEDDADEIAPNPARTVDYIDENGDAPGDQLIEPEQAYLVADMLRAVVLEGTGARARRLGRPLGGKTGTTNDQADAWFVGFSPEYATGVWVGFDEIRFLGAGETGSRAALPIWTDYMGAALAERPKRDFAVPSRSRLVWARIDRDTGLLASPDSEKTVFQPFIAGTQPTRTTAAARKTDRALQDLREDSFGDAAQQMQLDAF